MKIFSYTCTDPDVPAGHRAVARIMLNDGAWHPVLITGFDAEAAMARATGWWAEELARRAPKAPKPKKAQPVEKEPVQASVGVVEDPGDVV